MKQSIISAALLILVVGIVATPLSVFADSKCVPADGKSCVFNLKNGDVEVKDLTIGPFNLGSSGTVDQEARDGVTNANAEIVALQGELQTANSNVDALNATLTQAQATIAAQGDAITALQGQVANLSNSAITDIELSDDSVVIPPPVEPPVDNGTGTNSTDTNSTG